MSGLRAEYNAENADRYLQYAPDPWCYAHFWFPDGYQSLTNMPLCVRIPGGGWDGAHDTLYLNVHSPKDVVFDSDDLLNDLLDRGWVVAFLDYPPGININAYSRFHPVSRWPATSRRIGQFIQFCKTHAEDGLITGSVDSTLSTSHTRYLLDGNSAGAIESMWVALQPDKALPYYDRFVQTGGRNQFVYLYNHRVRAVLNTDGVPDMTKFEADTISSAAMPRYRPRENSFTSPAFLGVTARQKRQSSVLEMIEANYDENKHVGIFVNLKDGSAADGQSNPQTGCQGSYLGSGSALTYVVGSGALTGTPIVGETITGASTGSAVVKAHNTDLGIIYCERSSSAVFSGIITGATSGCSLTSSGYVLSGNNNRLAFLDYDAALALVDAAGPEGEVTDFTHVHEVLGGAQLKRALSANDAKNGIALHRFYLGNDYVAGLSGDTPSFFWSGLSYNEEALDWIENVLGIEGT